MKAIQFLQLQKKPNENPFGHTQLKTVQNRSVARTCNCLPNAGTLWKDCYSATFRDLET